MSALKIKLKIFAETIVNMVFEYHNLTEFKDSEWSEDFGFLIVDKYQSVFGYNNMVQLESGLRKAWEEQATRNRMINLVYSTVTRFDTIQQRIGHETHH